MYNPRPALFSALLFVFAHVVSADEASTNDPYRLWAESVWGKQTVNIPSKAATVWGSTANPDRDTSTNLQEYAFGTDPRKAQPSAVRVDKGVTLSGHLALTYSERTDDPALIVFPQYSFDQRTWFPSLPKDSFSFAGPNSFFWTHRITPISDGRREVVQVCTIPFATVKSLFVRAVAMRSQALAAGTTFDQIRFLDSSTNASQTNLESNSVFLTGFVGTISISVDNGAHIIVNGIDMGNTAVVTAGSTIRILGKSPFGTIFSPGTLAYNVMIGDHTFQWKVTTRPVAVLNPIQSVIAGQTPINTGVGNDGDANISIPITVPPGVLKMSPELSLTYSSHGGDGLIGRGWGISGLESITRIGRVRYLENVKSGVSFTSSDRFLYNGQRLILTSGVWGGDGAEYRTEIESFVRIISRGTSAAGPLYWEVYKRDGRILNFGASADSRVLANRPTVPGDTAAITWALTSTKDTSGNEIRYFYAPSEAKDSGYARISSIQYTANEKAGVPASCEVVFLYEDRPDVVKSFVGGAKIEMCKRLSAIECRNDGKVARRYECTYDASSFKSKLVSLLEKGKRPSDSNAAWDAYFPTQFSWTESPPPALSMKIVTPEISAALGKMFFNISPPSFLLQGDFNGDGRMDIMNCDRNNGISTWVAYGTQDGAFTFKQGNLGFSSSDHLETHNDDTYSKVRSGDFNGDGCTDVLQINLKGNNNWLALGRPDSTFVVKRGNELGGMNGVRVGYNDPFELISLDLNGDGVTDVVALTAEKDHNGYKIANRVFLGTATGSFNQVAAGAFANYSYNAVDKTYSWILPGDFNSDGLTDILHVYPGSRAWLALSNGDGTFTMRSASQLGGLSNVTFGGNATFVTAGDFNGDKVTDVAIFEKGTNPKSRIFLCKGDGTFEAPMSDPTIQGLSVCTPGFANSRLLSGDFDGDGLSDVFHASIPSSSMSWIALGNGNGSFRVSLNGTMGVLDNRQYVSTDERSQVFVGDYDGDGKDDILHLGYNYSQGSTLNYLARGSHFKQSRIVRVTSGHGDYAKFEYKPITDEAVHTMGKSSTYPYLDVVGPMYVVSSLSSRNGVDGDPEAGTQSAVIGETVIDYTYERAWAKLDDHGFSGFKAIQSVNRATQIVTRTENETSDPRLARRPTRILRALTSGRVISEADTQWTIEGRSFSNGAATSFVFPLRNVEYKYEISKPLGSAPISATVNRDPIYDNYGNQTQGVTEFSPGYIETTNSSFENDVSRWWLGRPSLVTTTVEVPASSVPPDMPSRSSRTMAYTYSEDTGLLRSQRVLAPQNEEYIGLETKFGRDVFGNIQKTSSTDLRTSETRVQITNYSSDGRFLTETRNAAGQVETKLYDPLDGTVVKSVDANGHDIDFITDAFGRERHRFENGIDSITQHFRFNPGGGFPNRGVYAVFTQTAGRPWKYTFFDVLDRQIGTLTPNFRGPGDGNFHLLQTRQVYDERGYLVQDSSPFLLGDSPTYTFYQRDELGRVRQETLPGGRVRITSYDGFTTSDTNPEGERFSKTTDCRGQTIGSSVLGTVSRPVSDTVRKTYSPFGFLSSVDDGNGHVARVGCDSRGNRIFILDPDSGLSSFTYNAFGEALTQTDAENRTTQRVYDSLGRLVRLIVPDGSNTIITEWTFDTAKNGIGKLARVRRLADAFEEAYVYDADGFMIDTITSIGLLKAITSHMFDEFKRPAGVKFPSGYAFLNDYNGDGYLLRVREAAGPTIFWTGNNMNQRQQYTQETLGNGLSISRSYDRDTGWLQRLSAGSEPTKLIQNATYRYDRVGALVSRSEDAVGVSEAFSYDSRHQISNISSTAAAPITVKCDALGNITESTDVGAYVYGENGAGPHAVTKIKTFAGTISRKLMYDKVGNCVQNGSALITYNASNLPVRIRNGPNSVWLGYTHDNLRLRVLESSSGVVTDKLCFGTLYERESVGVDLVHRHFIPGPNGVVAMVSLTQRPAALPGPDSKLETRYFLKDHLGSIVGLTLDTGVLEQRSDFSAWGRRRAIVAKKYTYAVPKSKVDKGFTGHEMLDSTGFIHMSGRVYDPRIGRFLSVDPFVQDPNKLQSLNRYQYVNNSPLSYTDPSGFDPDSESGARSDFSTAANFNGRAGGVNIGGFTLDQTYSFGSESSPFTGDLGSGGSVGDPLRSTRSVGGYGGAMLYSMDRITTLSTWTTDFPDWFMHAGSSLINPMRTGFRWEAGFDPLTHEPISRGRASVEVALEIIPAGRVPAKITEAIGAKFILKSGVQANRAKGLVAEAKAAEDLIANGNKILGSHVSAQTSAGRRVIDHLIETPTGQIIAIEVKSGNAVRGSSQLVKDSLMSSEGAVLVGKNAPDVLKGQQIILETIELRY
jgi:RHS repeat-associated protein